MAAVNWAKCPGAQWQGAASAGFNGGGSQERRHEEEKYLLLFHLPLALTSPGGSVQICSYLLPPRSRLLRGRTVTQNTSCCALFGGFQRFTGAQNAKVEL